MMSSAVTSASSGALRPGESRAIWMRAWLGCADAGSVGGVVGSWAVAWVGMGVDAERGVGGGGRTPRSLPARAAGGKLGRVDAPRLPAGAWWCKAPVFD